MSSGNGLIFPYGVLEVAWWLPEQGSLLQRGRVTLEL
jgi:hypothetical protein